MMTTVTRFLVFDTKHYDRKCLAPAAEAAGIELKFYDFRLEPDTVDSVRNAAGVCVFVNDHLPREVIDVLADAGIGMIALRCAGFNNVDVAAAEERGLTVVRVPAYSPYAVAEHAVALLMALNRKVARAHLRVHEMNFSLDGLVGFDVHGKTVGIVGTGRIGRAAAEIFAGFGTEVLVTDFYPDEEWAASHGFEYTDYETLIERSDIISLHTPLTPETLHLVDKSALAMMKDGVIIINVSRGALVDAKALVKALKRGKVGGVALDVYEEEEGVFFEDLSGHILMDDTLARLLSFPNVVITAHQAFLTQEALDEIARVTVENMQRFIEGEPPLQGTQLEA
jgi:D-lactate dehydrogenase